MIRPFFYSPKWTAFGSCPAAVTKSYNACRIVCTTFSPSTARRRRRGCSRRTRNSSSEITSPTSICVRVAKIYRKPLTNASKRLDSSSTRTHRKVWSNRHTLASRLLHSTIRTSIFACAVFCGCWTQCEIQMWAFRWQWNSEWNLKKGNWVHHDFFALILFRFLHLKPNVLLDRLVFRKHYGLSVHIAKHLQLPESRILEDWANNKVINDKGKGMIYYIIICILLICFFTI